ncbi:hypothetical protein TL16_g12589 [Triparma laevis f. inornata]|uniref:AB hydrolase-1 domain-containing protein n=1 Tax=Triparma laevis f. inornata TaxID=1714386 RepID=A0A9W7BMD4_9STRA|nr:hypothetical protein TL16_g12589 [Triparma laevis f. inornata]
MSIASHKLTIKRGENNFNDKAHKAADYSFHGKVDKKKPTMVFIHGWPDNGDVWKNQTDHFSKTHNCVTITLPHYGRRDAPAVKRFPLGCSIDQLMELSRNAVVEVLKKTGDGKIILMIHDWGSWVGLQLQRKYPNLISKCVVLDVAWVEYNRVTLNFRQIYALIKMGIGYQYYIIFCWWLTLNITPFNLGEKIGARLLEPMIAGMNVPKTSFGSRREEYPLNVYMGATYFYLHWQVIMQMMGYEQGFDDVHDVQDRTPLYSTEHPLDVLFIYSQDKGFRLHPRKFETLKKRKGSNVHSLGEKGMSNKIGHWLMTTAGEEVNGFIEEFLK